MRTLLIITFAIVLLWSCTKTNEEDLIKSSSLYQLCLKDSVTISYTNDIAPIMQNDCMPCHTATRADGGIALDNYNDVSTYAGGNLMDAVYQINGAVAMPKDAPVFLSFRHGIAVQPPDCAVAEFHAVIVVP